MNKIEKIVNSLKKTHITRPDVAVLSKISKSNRLLNFGAINTDHAISVYEDVKNMAHTETKSYIGKILGFRVNGSIFEDFPNIFSAKDATSSKMIKILCVADGASSLESRKQDLKNEIHACQFRHEAIVPMENARD